MEQYFLINEKDLELFAQKIVSKLDERTNRQTDEMVNNEVLKTEHESMKTLKCSQTTLWRLRKTGKIRFVQIGRRIMYPLEELQRIAREGCK